MRSPAHRNYRAGEPSRARSAGARPRRAHTNSCSGSRTPQADVAGGASRAHWYITVRAQIGASFSSFSGYREGFASSLRRASLFYHTWQHERSFVWAWSASCGTNRSFKAFVKFIRKRLNQGSQIGWFPKKIANGSFFTGTGVKTAQSPGRSERNSRGARAYLMMPRIRHERCARRASFGGAARVLAQLARFACCRQPGRAEKRSERAKTREMSSMPREKKKKIPPCCVLGASAKINSPPPARNSSSSPCLVARHEKNKKNPAMVRTLLRGVGVMPVGCPAQ